MRQAQVSHLDHIAQYQNGVSHQSADRPSDPGHRPGARLWPPGRHGCLERRMRFFGSSVVEDATESRGSTYHGRPCGGMGRVGVLSFNGNKIVTTGGGGAVITNDADLARRAKHLTTTAKVPHPWDFVHDVVGWNYRMPNLNAALGLAQLEQLPGFVAAKPQTRSPHHRRLCQTQRRDRDRRARRNGQQLLAQRHLA